MKSAAFFSFLILLANLLCVHFLATDVPVWDQWDSEAQLYIHWEEGKLTLADLIKPHVQHRMAVSRLFRIALYELSGGWSPLNNMIFQSFLMPLLFLVFWFFIKDRLTSLKRSLLFYSIATPIFLFPLYWEIILLGFQSHFYFSIIFAFLLIMTAARKQGAISLFIFVLVGVTTIFTSASSLIPLIVALVVQSVALYGIQQWRNRFSVCQVAANLLLIGMSLFFMVTPESQKVYMAHGFWNLFGLSLEAFSWPMEYVGIIALWIIPLSLVVRIYKPFSVESLQKLLACVYRDQSNLALFGLLLWLVLSVESIAFARGNYALFVSRYLTIYGFTLYVPFFLYLLFVDGVATLDLRPAIKKIMVVLYLILLVGLSRVMVKEFRKAIEYKHDMDIVKQNLITAMRQNSPDYLLEQQQIKPIYGAHPRPEKVFRILHHPALKGKQLWLPKELKNR